MITWDLFDMKLEGIIFKTNMGETDKITIAATYDEQDADSFMNM